MDIAYLNSSSARVIRGITLIELMVTLAILATIAAIAVPAYKGYIKTTYRTECIKEVAAIRLAEEEHFLEKNQYFVGEAGTGADDLETASSGIYEKSQELKNDTNNCAYVVTSADDTVTYLITANKVAGRKLDTETNPIVTFSKE